MRDVVLLRSADRDLLDRVIERSLAIITRVAGGPTETEVWRHARAGLALLQSSAAGATDTVAIHQNRKEAFTYSGFVSSPSFATEDVRRLIAIDRDPVMARSPGGIATYFLADARSRRLFAWSSHAGLEGPYLTEGPDCIAISNRPLLSHLVGRQTERPAFSAGWARRQIIGPSLWDDTPFEGTRQAPPRAAFVVDDEVRVAPHPIALDAPRYRRGDPAAVDALCAAALEAVAPLRRWPRGELWLSGGKDSRLALALVRRAGIDIDVVTHARAGAGEGEAAAAVAGALDVEHRIIQGGDIATGDQLLPAILGNLRRSDGLIGEPRTLAYRVAPGADGPIVQGQAHHPRGGFRIRLGPVRAEIEQQLEKQLLDGCNLVVEPLAAERIARLREIFGGYQDARDLGYWLYADWRASRFMTPAYASAARARMLLWPMMDERVLEVTAALHPTDRAVESAFFAALVQLAPELRDLPLYEATWRFDGSPVERSPFPEGRQARLAPFREQGRGRTAERRVGTIQPLLRRAMDTPAGDELRRAVRPDVLRVLLDEADPALALDRPHSQIINLMWRVAAVSLVMEGAWLTSTT